jgi:LPXTG-motif cell wall-anchored protein
MTEAHFAKYFGTISETSVKITYPSGAVVVSPPSVEPPQTGDAGTLVGFVMIALALAAAGYALVRKVRA